MKTLRTILILAAVAAISSIGTRAAATRPFDNALCEGELQECSKALEEEKTKVLDLQRQLAEAKQALADCQAASRKPLAH